MSLTETELQAEIDADERAWRAEEEVHAWDAKIDAYQRAHAKATTPDVEQRATAEAEWLAGSDCEYTQWKASGEPDLLAELLEKRRAEVADIRFARDDKRLREELDRIASLSNEQADAEWKAKQKVALVSLPANVPLHRKYELMAADADHQWAEIDGYSTPIPTCSDNVAVFLRRANVEVRFNHWLERIEICRSGSWTQYTDADFEQLMTLAAGAQHRFRPSEALFRRAVSTLARDNAVDPALMRLRQLESEWDGQARLAVWLTKCVGAPCDPYHQAAGAAIIGGMVRRIRRPGCKLDLMAVFIGEQGAGKSTLAQILALDPSWFTDSVQLGIEAKELLPLLRGRAIVEVSEMRTRGEADSIKAMISRQVDTARVAYGREPIERPRRNIFVGTTNAPEVLEDATGGRRFLPIEVAGEINLNWLRENIEQLVAEACVRESRGDTFNLPRETWAAAAEHQDAARAKKDFELVLEQVFAVEKGPLYVSAADLVVMVRHAIGRSVDPKAYGVTMRSLGFVRTTQRVQDIPTKVWRRGEPQQAQRVLSMTANPAMLPPSLPARGAGAVTGYER
jgi:hypothetical protein